MRFQHPYWCIAVTCLLLQVTLGCCLPVTTKKVRKRIGKVECWIRTYACLFFGQIYFTCVSNDTGEAKYLTVVPKQANLEQTGHDRYILASQEDAAKRSEQESLTRNSWPIFDLLFHYVLADPLCIQRHLEAKIRQ